MDFAEGLEDRALGREIEILVLVEQTLEDQLVRGAATQADVRPLVMDDLVVGVVELRRQARVRRTSSANRRRWRPRCSCVRRQGLSWSPALLDGGGRSARCALTRSQNYTARPALTTPRPDRAAIATGGSLPTFHAPCAQSQKSRTDRGADGGPPPDPGTSTPRAASAADSGPSAFASVCFDNFRPPCVERDGKVQIRRRRIPEPSLQPDLSRRRLQKVRAAHHVRDPLALSSTTTASW